jgi:predicted dehydrogenase
MGKSDVDDCVLFLARFAKGAVASFEASRLATGRQNYNGIEINGDKGALSFNFEDMNNLYFHDATQEVKTAGWTKIMCTKGGAHPYAANWWPDAHLIGYEHTFINQLADTLRVIGGQKPVTPLADFADAYETQRVLEAALISAKERQAIRMSEVK